MFRLRLIVGPAVSETIQIETQDADESLVHSMIVANHLPIMVSVRSLGSASSELSRVDDENVLVHVVVKGRHLCIKRSYVLVQRRHDEGVGMLPGDQRPGVGRLRHSKSPH